jgi:hypothetical protein
MRRLRASFDADAKGDFDADAKGEGLADITTLDDAACCWEVEAVLWSSSWSSSLSSRCCMENRTWVRGAGGVDETGEVSKSGKWTCCRGRMLVAIAGSSGGDMELERLLRTGIFVVALDGGLNMGLMSDEGGLDLDFGDLGDLDMLGAKPPTKLFDRLDGGARASMFRLT